MVSGLSFRTARSLFPYRPVIFALFLLTLCPGPAFAWKNVGSGSAAVPCTTYYQGSLGYNYTSNTVEFCNGTAWGNLVASGTSSGINLGTSVSATNPSVTGDLTTGLFSAATSTVAIAIAGVQTMTVTSTGVGIGSAVPGAVLDLSQNTGALILPIGPTSAEPSPAVNGMIRYNSTYPDVEAYIGNAWTTLTTGGANAGIDLGTSATATNPSVTGDPTTGLFSPAATTVAVAVGGVEAVRVNSSGYVGIGTTSPAHLFDAEMGGVGPQIVASFGNTDTGAGTSEARIVFNQAGPNYFQGISGAYNYGSPYLSFSVNSSYNLWAEKMRIQSNGNVGIGTTSPGSALTVYSASPASPYSGIALYSGGASNYTAYTVGRTGVDGYFGVAGITGNYIGNAVSGDVVLLASTGKLQLGTGFGNNAGLTVASDGVEIGNQTYTSGTVRNPGMHLYTDDAFGMELNYNNSSWGTAVFGRSSDTVALRFGAYASNATAQNTFSPYITILNSGNVGIGTASPAEPLEIYSSGSGILLQLAGSSGTCNHTPGSSSETVSCSSDMRLKSGVIDAPSALPWLSSIRVRDFTWMSTRQKHTGVIAQELQKTRPEMVTYDEAADQWTVEQPNPWTLVKILQEQQAEIDDLKAQLATKH